MAVLAAYLSDEESEYKIIIILLTYLSLNKKIIIKKFHHSFCALRHIVLSFYLTIGVQ